MFQFTYKLKVAERVKGKCERHPRYNPERDGRGSIKGGCNFQAWLKHSVVFLKLLATFAAQTLATRYHADPSAADWRRFGRLPGFTDCKPKYKRPDGLFPFVRLKSHSGEQYPMAETFAQEIIRLYQEREQQREAKRLHASLSPRGELPSRCRSRTTKGGLQGSPGCNRRSRRASFPLKVHPPLWSDPPMLPRPVKVAAAAVIAVKCPAW